MTQKRFLFLLLLIIILIVGISLRLLEQTSTSSARPTALSSASAFSMKLEWGEKLPMDWRAEQSLIVRDVVYFSNLGLTTGGSPGDTPIIAAFNLNTKELLWRIEQKPLVPMESDGERLFVLTDKGIVAISTKDGSKLWQTVVTSQNEYYDDDELLAGDGWIFYGDNNSGRSTIYALDAQTGNIIWATPLAAPMDWFKANIASSLRTEYRVMNYDRGTLYVRIVIDLSSKERFRFMLTTLNAKDGHRLWDFPFEIPTSQGDGPAGGAASRLAFGKQEVYLGAFGGTSYALQRDTGQVLWKREVSIVRPVYINDQIVAVSGNGKVADMDARTGDLKWTVPFMDRGLGTLSPFVFRDGHLIFYASDPHGGQLSVVEMSSGKRVFAMEPAFSRECNLSPTALALHSEHLYLVTLNCVYSFQVSQ